MPVEVPFAFEWSQSGSAVELRIPISTLGENVVPRELDVTIKESDILCVTSAGTVALQQRLQDDVKLDNWVVEEGILVLDLVKSDEETWTCVMRQPIKGTDPMLFTREALDELLRKEMPRLPRDTDIDAELAQLDSAPPTRATDESVAAVAAPEEVGAAENDAESQEEQTAKDEEASPATAPADGNVEATEPEETTVNTAASTTTDAADDSKTTPPPPAAADDDDFDDLLDDAMDELEDQQQQQQQQQPVVAPVAESTDPAIDASATEGAASSERKAAAPSSSTVTADAVAVEEDADEKNLLLDDELDGDDEAAKEKLMLRELIAEGHKKAIQHELEMTKEEFDSLAEVRAELVKQIEDEETDQEKRDKAKEHLTIVDKMSVVQKRVRQLRSRRPTIAVLLEVLRLELWKGRLNIAMTEEHETEEYDNDEERAMSGHQLLKKGLEVQEEEPAKALHYYRLAALQLNHPPSTQMLFRIYGQNRPTQPKAFYFALRRAVMDDDIDPSTNHVVAEYADNGAPFFPPYMALVVYFYQRAAMSGSVASMLAVASTFKNGATAASPSSPEIRKAHRDETRFLQWLQAAEDRGSTRAYFMRAHLHATGEFGHEKSASKASQYLAKVKKTDPGFLSRFPGLESRIQLLQNEEKHGASAPAAAPASSSAATTNGAVVAATAKPAGESQAVATRSMTDRLRALEKSAGGSATANMDMTAGRGGRGGMLSKGRGGANKAGDWWQSKVEAGVRYGLAAYFSYSLLFPLRMMIMPYAFEAIATAMDVFGLGSHVVMRPSELGAF